MSVSFEVYPRRLVTLPGGGQALVVVRRDVGAKFNFLNAWDLRWEFAQLRRLLRRDRRWRVELYHGVHGDPQATPRQDPDRAWVPGDRHAAAAFAEILSGHLQRSGDAEPLPDP